MRITFLVVDPNLGGGHRVIAMHALGLKARGHDVTVLASPAPPLARRHRLKALLRGELRRRSGESHFDQLGVPLRWLDSARPFRAEDVPDGDAVIATWWPTAFDAAYLPRRAGSGFYFVQHHEVFYRGQESLAAGSYHLPLRKVVVSRWLSEVMAERYGDTDVDLVLNAVDHGAFHAPPRGKQARPTVGFMYSTAPGKGLEAARTALLELHRRRPDLRVKAVWPYKMVKDEPLAEIAEFVLSPSPEELRECYASVDVWLCASQVEGFCLPILEALACGTPVVSTRAGAAADLIDEGRTGHIVPPDDAEALADRMDRVLQLDETAWRAASEAARTRAKQETWDVATDRFEAALHRGLSAAGTP